MAKLLTTMGMGRVMMNTPHRAHSPHTNLPMKVLIMRQLARSRDMQRVPGLLMVTHCGERHQAPPDAVIK